MPAAVLQTCTSGSPGQQEQWRVNQSLVAASPPTLEQIVSQHHIRCVLQTLGCTPVHMRMHKPVSLRGHGWHTPAAHDAAMLQCIVGFVSRPTKLLCEPGSSSCFVGCWDRYTRQNSWQNIGTCTHACKHQALKSTFALHHMPGPNQCCKICKVTLCQLSTRHVPLYKMACAIHRPAARLAAVSAAPEMVEPPQVARLRPAGGDILSKTSAGKKRPQDSSTTSAKTFDGTRVRLARLQGLPTNTHRGPSCLAAM